MTRTIKDAVLSSILAGDVSLLTRLVLIHGATVARLEDEPSELTALHCAAGLGRERVVSFLLAPRVGADPRASRLNDFTPLHSAAMNGHHGICDALLSAGADVNAQTRPQGYAPLHNAALGGHVQTIRVLLSAGADRELVNHRGERPVDTARRQGQDEVVRLLE